MLLVCCRCVLATGGRALFHRLTGSKTLEESPSTLKVPLPVPMQCQCTLHISPPPFLPIYSSTIHAIRPHSESPHQLVNSAVQSTNRPPYQLEAHCRARSRRCNRTGAMAKALPSGMADVLPISSSHRLPSQGCCRALQLFTRLGALFCIPTSFADVVQSRSPHAHHHWAAQASLSTARPGLS